MRKDQRKITQTIELNKYKWINIKDYKICKIVRRKFGCKKILCKKVGAKNFAQKWIWENNGMI